VKDLYTVVGRALFFPSSLCAVWLRRQPESWEEGVGNSRVTEINGQRMIRS